MSFKQPQNQTQKYDHLFSDIKAGRVKIPQFQRDFVWDKQRSAKLLDSLIKGFPIGTFILWKTNEQLRHIRNLGNIDLPELATNEKVAYVLDGQQRITSLFAVREGVIIKRDGQEVDYKDIVIDLVAPLDSDDEVVRTETPEGREADHISVHYLLSAGIGDFVKDYNEHIDAIDFYKRQLTTYDFSTIVIDEYPIDIACEVFTRINTGGKTLSLFEIMVAKTYDHEKAFDLSLEYDHLISNSSGDSDEKDLTTAGFETVPNVTVLLCIAACLLPGEIPRKDILRLGREQVIEAWPAVKTALFLAIDWLRSSMNLRVSRLLPYNTLLIPLTYFFYHQGASPVSSSEDARLKQYFFWAALGNRFTSSVGTKIGEDKRRMDAIRTGTEPKYPANELKIDPEALSWTRFSTGDAYSLAILCLYAMQQPQSFANNSLVQLDNSWLKRSNSKNFHHFFPSAFLKKNNWETSRINVVLNITFVDDYLNKYRIKAKAPSDYTAEFEKDNPQFQQALSTHLIGTPDDFGIAEDDYESFIESRAVLVATKLNSLLSGLPPQ